MMPRAILLVSALSSLQACVPPDAGPGQDAQYGDCPALTGLQLAGASITLAKAVVDGRPAIPDPGPYDETTLAGLPPFCRVAGTASPVPGSRIGFEVWLPASGWNDRLLMLGNGGYSSTIPYGAFAEFLRKGYAVTATDTGHSGDDPEFAVGRPEAIADWAHRAVHVSRDHAETATEAFFGRPPKYTYFAGCSTGGHQALTSAQRYPQDFDGILAGAPGHNRTHLNAGFLWQFLVNHRPDGGAATILPADKLAMINDAVLRQCRENNGTSSGGLPTDPYLADPLACDVAVDQLLCEPGDDPNACLTPDQARVLEAIYAGASNPRTGERIYFGQTPGSETAGGPPGLPGWSLYWADPRQPGHPARASFWQFWVFHDADWDWWTFDFDADMRRTDRQLAAVINAMDADLAGFRRAGGKLLHYHGLNDPVVPATDSISYFSRVTAENRSSGDFYRLFLAPGMEHCRGGPGPDSLELLPALEAWVERGRMPDRIVATKFEGDDPAGDVEFTRPLCPYPQYAVYNGTGDTRKASSFTCKADMPRPPVPKIAPEYLR